ncbi:MAG: MoaD/ThiS family protein [Chloroflexi bacterium]|nr:MoaD/ThiS family protein [Chloroflexota bacterium]
MQVRVRFAEPFWRSIGEREIEIELDSNTLVGDLIGLLTQRYSSLGQEFNEAPPVIFLGDEEVDRETFLTEDCQIHFVWPLAGG